jgi:hypothetical protein
MGGIVRRCDACNGVGWLDPDNGVTREQARAIENAIPVEVKVDSLTNVNGEPVKAIVKRRGRPPRVTEART